MTLVVDTGPLIALLDPKDPVQPVVEGILSNEVGALILPAPVSAEVDYLVRKYVGPAAGRAFLSDLTAGRFQVACLEPAEYELVLGYDEQYANLEVGLADISVAVLAHRFRTRRILTFDQRHFRVLRSLDGNGFVLLPHDEAEPTR